MVASTGFRVRVAWCRIPCATGPLLALLARMNGENGFFDCRVRVFHYHLSPRTTSFTIYTNPTVQPEQTIIWHIIVRSPTHLHSNISRRSIIHFPSFNHCSAVHTSTMRLSGLIPLLFTLAAFILTMLCIFAGSSKNYLEGADMLTVPLPPPSPPTPQNHPKLTKQPGEHIPPGAKHTQHQQTHLEIPPIHRKRHPILAQRRRLRPRQVSPHPRLLLGALAQLLRGVLHARPHCELDRRSVKECHVLFEPHLLLPLRSRGRDPE